MLRRYRPFLEAWSMAVRKKTIRLIAVVIAAGSMIPAHAGDIYRWVDDKGVVHFGEKPPDAVNSQSMSVKVTAPSSDAAAAQKRLEEIRAAAQKRAPDNEPAPGIQDEEMRKAIARNCEIYRKNLETMTNSPRVKETLPNGELAFLGEDEKTKRMAETEKLIAQHCKDLPAP